MRRLYVGLALAALLALMAGCAPAPAATPIARAALPTASPGVPAQTVAATAAPTEALPTAAPGATQITLLHTNDTWGYVRPCG